jgi:hypothetical protein
MITVSITYLVIGGVVLLYLLFKLFECKSKMVKPEQVFIDSSGIAKNPPQFIEVLQHKTINFVVNGEKIVISQLSIGRGLGIVRKISLLYEKLVREFDKIPKNKIEEVRDNLIRGAVFNQIVVQIYLLSKPFAKSKRKLRKALYKLGKTNQEKVLLITEQIFDYWMYIKKLLALLSRGGTQRMIIGAESTWSSYETDMTGNHIIKPRFGSSMN